MAFRRIGHRPIPTKRVIKGDYQKGMEYIGQAMKQLMQLENAMRFQKLKQLSSTFKDENVVIECWHGFGLSEVTITTRGGGEGKRVEETRKCLCSPCFALAIVLKTHDLADDDYLAGLRFKYDIEICLNEKEYIQLIDHDVRSAGWEKYTEGQIVLATIDVVDTETDLFDCCSDEMCLMEKIRSQEEESYTLMLVPFVTAGMKKWITQSQIFRQ